MKEMPPEVSVILTSYNKTLTLGEAIESVISQTYGNWELFIMDDNSNFETVKVINRYLNDQRIRYFNSNIQDSERYKTTRYATLINEAIPKTTGKYITYLTDDNEFLPDRFTVMTNYMNQHPEIHAVYSKQKVKFRMGNGKMSKQRTRKTYGILNQAAGYVDHCSVMHTREVADKIYDKYGSYWDEDPKHWYNGDAAFWNRLTEFTPFYPIDKILDLAYKDSNSFQNLYIHMPKRIPDGTLVKGPSTEVFLIEKQCRRKIARDLFSEFKYSNGKVVNIPDPFVYKYNEGTPIDFSIFTSAQLLPIQRLIRSEEKAEIFYLQNKKKHLIPSPKIFNEYHFNSEEIVIINDRIIKNIDSGPAFKSLAAADEIIPDGVLYLFNSNYYYSENNTLLQISPQTAVKLKLPVNHPVRVDSSFIQKFAKSNDTI
ncbi:glycosyltransferase family 2 protein [Cytobacillus firmus]|uniref:glycosyltransferase family 2 protein n=1 Tax=Cytobacillus firmus TaxID=1399 RepID=UPI0024942E1E|nr:glycosyltransferase family 2 protein [Cytobacillus firmus]